MPPSIWDLRSSADFDRFPLSPTPPVIRLLYWSMCRAVSVAQLSYLFKYWKSSTTKYKWVCLLLKCNFVTKIRNNLKLLPTASQCGEKLHHFSFIFHLTDFNKLKIEYAFPIMSCSPLLNWLHLEDVLHKCTDRYQEQTNYVEKAEMTLRVESFNLFHKCFHCYVFQRDNYSKT